MLPPQPHYRLTPLNSLFDVAGVLFGSRRRHKIILIDHAYEVHADEVHTCKVLIRLRGVRCTPAMGTFIRSSLPVNVVVGWIPPSPAQAHVCTSTLYVATCPSAAQHRSFSFLSSRLVVRFS